MALFSLATYLCGAAESLETWCIWRMVQGAAGAPVTPLSQTILFDSFPRRQHRMITSIYGMTVVIGPVIGPALGGYMAELYSWRWAFYGLVPVGVVSCIGLRLSMLRDPPRHRVRLDWIGFLSLSAAISCVQLVLSRGQRLDWYESPEIWLDDDRRRPRLLYLRRAQRDRGAAVPEPAPAARPQLRARAAAGRRVRHAERHADGAAAAAVEAVCRVSRRR